MAADETAAPLLRIVRGYPTPEELAAVVALVAAATSGPRRSHAATEARDAWADPSRRVRKTRHPDLGDLSDESWWLSGLPL